MDAEQQRRAYVNSLLPALRRGDAAAFDRLTEVMVADLPARFARLHLLDAEARKLIERAVASVQIPRVLAPGDDLFDSVIAQAEDVARTWLHDLQRRARDWTRASHIQNRLLEGSPFAAPGLEIACGHRAAREVTGDLYGVYGRGEEYTLIALGDAEGKGAPAAVYGAVVMGCLRSQASHLSDPATILGTVNTLLPGEGEAGRTATLTIALWDTTARTFTFANSGGVPALYLRNDTQIPIHPAGIPIGMFDRPLAYESQTIHAQPGDLLVFCSDGVPDQSGPASETRYGLNRLTVLVRERSHLPCRSIQEAIFTDLDAFADGTTRSDDQTVVVVRVRRAG